MRLPFLTATIVPILLGAAVASKFVSIDWFYFALTMLGGFLLHIGTNTSNDYYDTLVGQMKQITTTWCLFQEAVGVFKWDLSQLKVC